MGVDDEVIQTAAVEYAPVSFAMFLIRDVETSGVNVEGV